MDLHIAGAETDGQVAMARVRYLYEAPLRCADGGEAGKAGADDGDLYR